MESFLYLLWFLVSLPALPLVALWSMTWPPSHGTSGQLGLFFVSSFLGGIVLWSAIGVAYWFTWISLPSVTITWS